MALKEPDVNNPRCQPGVDAPLYPGALKEHNMNKVVASTIHHLLFIRVHFFRRKTM